MSVSPIPPGYHTVTPYLIVHDGNAALEFYQKAFGAEVKVRMGGPDKVGHAEILVGDSMIMLADEFPERDVLSAKTIGKTPVSICLYVPDADAWFARAVAAGATVLQPLKDQFYGDRLGTLSDPFGHHWSLATHVEDVTPDEMERRMAAAQAG